MKFKMAQNSIFALLLRSPWWVSGGIALVIALIAVAIVPRQYVIYGIFTGMPFMIVSVMAPVSYTHLTLPTIYSV